MFVGVIDSHPITHQSFTPEKKLLKSHKTLLLKQRFFNVRKKHIKTLGLGRQGVGFL